MLLFLKKEKKKKQTVSASSVGNDNQAKASRQTPRGAANGNERVKEERKYSLVVAIRAR